MSKMLKNSRAVSKAVLVTIIVIVLAVCVTAGFAVYQLRPANNPSPTPTPTIAPTPTPTATPTPQPTNDQGGTAAQEKISIQGVSYDAGSKVLTIYAQSTTISDVTPVANGIIIKDTSGNTVVTLGIGTISPTATGNALAAGTLYDIQSTVYSTGLNAGTYTATLTTSAGGSFVSPSFVVS